MKEHCVCQQDFDLTKEGVVDDPVSDVSYQLTFNELGHLLVESSGMKVS